MMDIIDTPASPPAISSCAPYGIRPWTRHEKVSSMLAVFLGSRPNLRVMSRAMCPVVIMAIVLLAVHRLARATRPAMLSSAPRFPLILLVIPDTMKSSPPFARMISSIPPASIVTIMRSPIPLMPSPIEQSRPLHPKSPVVKPMTPLTRRPAASTTATLTPDNAKAMTRR